MPTKKAVRLLTPDEIAAAVERLKVKERDSLIGEILPVGMKRDLSAKRWPLKMRRKLGLLVKVVVYSQDPYVAARYPAAGLQEVELDWEPGFMDGPTSSRVAVVDFNGDENTISEPARWSEKAWAFVNQSGEPITEADASSHQFHQVAAWAAVEKVLRFYESSSILGRAVPWAFDGNRLIVVPHAGWGENAYYDRSSKSLQFYYCGSEDKPVYTCLSNDIVAHEAGHAVLDGIRPYYIMNTSVQTGAFHEYIADLTAILLALRNNDLRGALNKATGGDLTVPSFISDLAEEFGNQVSGRPYLRTARSQLKMSHIEGKLSPHLCSEVLTGAAYDIMKGLAGSYLTRSAERDGKPSPARALWHMTDRVRRVLLQPLDYCPPVDVQFTDYVRAVIRRDQTANPRDPHEYRKMMREVYGNRELSCPASEEEPSYTEYVSKRIDIDASSKAAAYRFLHGKRDQFLIPAREDITVIEPYAAYKVRRANDRLPRESVLQYIWAEDVKLVGSRFGRLEGEVVPLMCGGTLVYDSRGNLLSWSYKPGTQATPGRKTEEAKIAREEGERRREQLLNYVAALVDCGLVGFADDAAAQGLVSSKPVVARKVHGAVNLQVISHLRHWGAEEGGQR